jgi:hypothetical protein
MFAPTIGEIKDFCFSNTEELARNEFIPRRGNKSFSSQFARQENLFMEATYQGTDSNCHREAVPQLQSA